MKGKPLPEKVIAWMIEHELKTSSGDRFEWYEHEFALDPVSDMHPYQAINKCAQVGFSEMFSCKTAYLARECGLDVGYTIHNAQAMDDFAQTKFDPIIRNNPSIAQYIGGNTRKKVVKYNTPEGKEYERFIHFVGAYNSASANSQEKSTVGISFTADILIHDEASRSDQYVINQLQSRLLNSDYGYIWKFDNPLYPGFGADKIWQESDQMHWIVTCHHCNKKQYLDWIRLDKHPYEAGANHCWVDADEKCLRCAKCMKPLSDEDRRSGQWIPKWSNKGGQHKNGEYYGYRGYWINQLMYVKHSIAKILEKEQGADAMSPSVFSNMVLGKPYMASDVKVSRTTIIENIRNRPEGKKGFVCMGVDQGREKQWVIGDEHGIFAIGRCRTEEDIQQLIQSYKVQCIVVDALPETGWPKRLYKKYMIDNQEKEVLFYRALYKPESDQSELARFCPKNDRSIVLIRRDEMFDVIANEFADGNVPINLHPNQLNDHKYIDEWQNLVRIIEKDRNGNDRFRWDQSLGPADMCHATLYWRVAMMKRPRNGGSSVQKMKSSDKVTNKILTAEDIVKQYEQSISK